MRAKRTERFSGVLGLVISGLAGMTVSQVANAAEQYPTKPIRFIVPYAAGGNGDVVARIVASKLQDRLGQRLIIDNRAGAGGNIGASEAKRAKPDGYTIVLGTNTHVINMGLSPDIDYDLSKDFAPVSEITIAPMVLLVHPSVPAKNVSELIALAKSKPGDLNFGSSGNGTSAHAITEAFDSNVGIKMTHVPFKAVSGALTDLLAGRIQVYFNSVATAVEVIRGGKARALAITSTERSPALPDVPTFPQAGVPGFDAAIWQGILAPKGTPVEIVQLLNREIAVTLADPTVAKQLEAQGVDPKLTTPAEFQQLIDSEVIRWNKVIKDTNMKLE